MICVGELRDGLCLPASNAAARLEAGGKAVVVSLGSAGAFEDEKIRGTVTCLILPLSMSRSV